MKTYKTFEEYMYDNYYDVIYNKVKNFLFQKKRSSFLATDIIPDVNYFELEDFNIAGVTFSTPCADILNFRLSLTVEVSVWGKSRYDYESDSKSVWVSMNFTSILKNGLKNVKITGVEEYSKERFNKESKLDHFLVPYLYSEDADNVAENFLKEYYPNAVETPMPLPIEKIVHNLGLKIYYAPLNNTTFGRTYFDTAVVTVYTNLRSRSTAEITISAGTLLVNPDVYFMRNVGSENNTIIHECVHWKRHRMFFELKRLLNQDFSYISCEIVESYGKEKSNSTPLDWIEWQANTLAPKILMPASTTKKFIQDRLHYLRQSMPASTRDAEVMAQAIQDTADEIGNHITKWEETFSLWACVTTKSVTETTDAGVTKEVQKLEFLIRQSPASININSTAFRILFRGNIYDITGITTFYDHNSYMKIEGETRKAGVPDDFN